MKAKTFDKPSGVDTASNVRVEQMAISRPQKGRLAELHGNYGIYFELVGGDYNTGFDMGLKEEDSLIDKAFTEQLCALTGVGSIAEMDGKVIEVMLKDHATIVAIRQDSGAVEELVCEAEPGGDWLVIDDFLAEYRA
ncbi:hypothetical protein KA344_05780 [bacterium]|nr:hypothetical protein [bacterium]